MRYELKKNLTVTHMIDLVNLSRKNVHYLTISSVTMVTISSVTMLSLQYFGT